MNSWRLFDIVHCSLWKLLQFLSLISCISNHNSSNILGIVYENVKGECEVLSLRTFINVKRCLSYFSPLIFLNKLETLFLISRIPKTILAPTLSGFWVVIVVSLLSDWSIDVDMVSICLDVSDDVSVLLVCPPHFRSHSSLLRKLFPFPRHPP